MSLVLQRIQAKVTRAEQHIQDLQLALSAFIETSPYEIVGEESAQTGMYEFRVSKADPVPDPVAAIAADVIQNLRTPLDHIAYQLVLNGSAKADKVVYFPITSTASEYPALRARNIKGVRQEVIDAIDATEPYKGGKGHALWQLNELNKPDKHHLLIGAFTAFRLQLVLLNIGPISMGLSFDSPTVVPNVGDIVFSIDPQMAHNCRFRFCVALNAPGVLEPEPALKTLKDLSNLVGSIVSELGRFLP